MKTGPSDSTNGFIRLLPFAISDKRGFSQTRYMVQKKIPLNATLVYKILKLWSLYFGVLLHLLWNGDISLQPSVVESSVCWNQFISHLSPAEINVWNQEALLPVAGCACAFRFARMNT